MNLYFYIFLCHLCIFKLLSTVSHAVYVVYYSLQLQFAPVNKLKRRHSPPPNPPLGAAGLLSHGAAVAASTVSGCARPHVLQIQIVRVCVPSLVHVCECLESALLSSGREDAACPQVLISNPKLLAFQSGNISG